MYSILQHYSRHQEKLSSLMYVSFAAACLFCAIIQPTHAAYKVLTDPPYETCASRHTGKRSIYHSRLTFPSKIRLPCPNFQTILYSCLQASFLCFLLSSLLQTTCHQANSRNPGIDYADYLRWNQSRCYARCRTEELSFLKNHSFLKKC